MSDYSAKRILVILEEVKKNLQDKTFWKEEESYSRNAKELLRKSVADKTKLNIVNK